MTGHKSEGAMRRRKRKESAVSPDSSTPSNGTVASSVSLGSFWTRVFLVATFVVVSFVILKRFFPNDEITSQESEKKEPVRPVGEDDHYAVLEILPHDPTAFTQGLTFVDGRLYEGTGNYGSSELRHVDPQSGKTLSSHALDKKYFGEGITHFEDDQGETRLIQLTWREKKGFVYRINDLQVIQEFTYETTTGQGWGITYNPDEKEFVVSDGSSTLLFWDRDTFQEKRRLQVTIPTGRHSSQQTTKTQPVMYLNELEWENGTILCNVWYQDVLIRIDPATGFVQRVYDFSKLYQDRISSADCFNGIALTDAVGELYVTGKWWPHMYRVKLLV